MKKFVIFVFLALLASGNVGLLAQLAPGDDEDPPNGPVIVDENDPGIDPAVLEDFNENFAPWLQPPGLSIEGLPEPIGFELWKTGGGPELVRTFSNELGVWQAAERAEAEAFSKRTGMPLVWRDRLVRLDPWDNGEISFPIERPVQYYHFFAVMVGVEHGEPVYLTTANVEAADTMGTDELWTINSALLHGLSGLNLNGEGTQLAMWDRGDVLASHQEFAIANSAGEVSSRVIDGDDVTDAGADQHATLDAGTLVATGDDPRAKGMSPHATLLAHDYLNDFTEMTAAFANTNNHFRLSNNSYDRHAGWGGWINYSNNYYPIWRGVPAVNATEDYKFGFYGERSQAVDDIAYWSRYYLSVWPAGNERGNPGRPYGIPDVDGQFHLTSVTNRYFALTNQVTTNTINGISTLVTNMTPVLHTNTLPANDFDVDGGYDLLRAYTVNKNGLVVGAVRKIPGGYGSLTTNVVTTTSITTFPDGMMVTNTVMTTNVIVNTNVVMTQFSSWGPTDDGRIKPDVVAAGEHIYSTDIDQSTSTNDVNMSYRTVSGTSIAAPTVAGSLNLLVQLHRRQVGTNNQPMLASTLRALAIHTADEAGDHPGPDYRFGWGLFNALSAANLMTNNFHSDSLAHIKEVPLYNIRTVVTNGTTKDYTDYIKFPVVARGNEPLKVTLCWNDPPPQTLPAPALDSTKRMLVNDLNLYLTRYTTVTNSNTNINTSMTRYRPWVLDPANPARAARRGYNSRDNVEQVVVESPITNGVYEVNVTKRGRRRRLTFPLRPVTGSAMAYTNQAVWTNQWVSLLISGNVPQPEPALEITDDLSETNFISLRWSSVVGRVYQVQCQTNIVLSQGWLPASGEIAATRTSTAVRLPLLHTNAPSCFYRIRRVR